MDDRLLRVADLSCEREGRALFNALNLSLNAGDCVALTGPNGSGKSTLLRCITGLYPDYEGEIEAARSSYLGHRPAVSPGLTVMENLRWYAGLSSAQASCDSDLIERLESVGLAGYEDVLCGRLSAGQQRRVALVRLALDDSPLWLLDEPFTALDLNGQDLVRALIAEHQRNGGAALCATHQDLAVPEATELRLGGRQ
jgi:heme exporter protein A